MKIQHHQEIKDKWQSSTDECERLEFFNEVLDTWVEIAYTAGFPAEFSYRIVKVVFESPGE